jgi:hypothetical protein
MSEDIIDKLIRLARGDIDLVNYAIARAAAETGTADLDRVVAEIVAGLTPEKGE